MREEERRRALARGRLSARPPMRGAALLLNHTLAAPSSPLQLFTETTPKTAENFRALCTGAGWWCVVVPRHARAHAPAEGGAAGGQAAGGTRHSR